MAPDAGADSIISQRLRGALGPGITLVREIARGGMGIVFLAHDMALDRAVAVKLLMPEHATAELAARFTREARVLAKLRHPNIVSVHQVGEKDGLFFYIMECLEGETLQARLARGPLSFKEVLRMGTDLLEALSAAHQQKWVHRDVKPGNIFCTPSRSVLTDFGIAHPLDMDFTSLTDTRQRIGTLAYMSPEQRDGRPVTERSDIYSAGLVIYEAYTGQRWWQRDPTVKRDWAAMPGRLRRVLLKALSEEPGERWESADAFHQALTSVPRSRRATPAAILGALVVGVGVFLAFKPRPPEPGGSESIRLQSLAFTGIGGWGDSIGQTVVAGLAGFPDLVVSGPFRASARELRQPGLVLTGSVERTGDRLEATIRFRAKAGQPILVSQAGDLNTWRILADSLADRVLYAIYVSDTLQDPWLPSAALPRSAAGWREWSRAESLFTQARWGEAAAAYLAAEKADSSCLLCSFRINDIDRWLDRPHDPNRMERLARHTDDFPLHYRFLIRAANSRWPDRMALMDSATGTREFFLAFFHKGDELFHRGPLFGGSRHEAMSEFERAVTLRSDFAPAWEHLAWVRIAEGDSAGARNALDSLSLAGDAADQTSMGLRFLLQAAYAYRFLPPGSGDALVEGALQLPEMSSFPYLAMAPRLMLTFDAPGASLGMGRIFANRRSVAEVRSGLLAQVMGHLNQGRPDSALHYARLLQARVPGIQQEIFALQLDGAIALLEPDSSASSSPQTRRAREELRRYTMPSAANEEARTRAAWMYALLSRRAGDAAGVRQGQRVLRTGSAPARSYYLRLVQADELAAQGQLARALAETDWNGDDLVRLPDPFFSAIVHFLRADWFQRDRNPLAALRTLRWHEAYDFGTYPTGDPQPPEVDQALGNLARWRQVRVLEAESQPNPDACRPYRAIAEHWATGSSPYQSRADTARQRLAILSCPRP